MASATLSSLKNQQKTSKYISQNLGSPVSDYSKWRTVQVTNTLMARKSALEHSLVKNAHNPHYKAEHFASYKLWCLFAEGNLTAFSKNKSEVFV